MLPLFEEVQANILIIRPCIGGGSVTGDVEVFIMDEDSSYPDALRDVQSEIFEKDLENG